MSNWHPILHGDSMRRANGALHHINRTLHLTNLDDTDIGPSLGNGAAGAALFLAYRSIHAAEDVARATYNQAMTVLCSAAKAAEFGENIPSLLEGLTGIAWTFDHLRLTHRIVSPHEDYTPRTQVDSILLELVSQRPWRGVYELGHGLVGYGLYAAEDLDAPRHEELLAKVVDQLATTALPTSNGGVTWWTAPQNLGGAQRKQAPMGHFNLGVAHGIPSVVALLGLACRLGVNEAKARDLAIRAMTWLRAQQQPESAGSHFGTIIPLGTRLVPSASRVGWCFGDLGVSAAMYSAARNMEDAVLADEALSIARKTARRAPDTCDVRTSGICHGSAGTAHIFNRFYHATYEQEFLDSARYWFERTLDYYDSWLSSSLVTSARRGPREGDMADTVDETEDVFVGWRDDPGFFGGLAGVGLALLSATTEIEPSWDRILLVSIPPGDAIGAESMHPRPLK